jgi:hypothetical protein
MVTPILISNGMFALIFFNLARSPLVFRGKHGQTCKNRSDRAIRFQKLSALGRPSWGQTRQHKKEAERAIR